MINFTLTSADYWGIAPISCLTLLGVLMLLGDLVKCEKTKSWLGTVCALGLALCGLVTYVARHHVGHGLMGGSVDLDLFSVLMTEVLILSGILVVLMAPGYMAGGGVPAGPFYAMLVFAITGGALLTQAADLITLFIGIETLSLTLYLLVGLQNKDIRSPEASMKYFLTGSFASAVMLYGMAMIYGATRSVGFTSIQTHLHGYMPWFEIMGLGMVVLAFLFKIGSVPTHMWVPDVYEGSPTPITAFLASGAKVAAYAGFLKFLYVAMIGRTAVWVPILMTVSIMTMIYGNIAALAQVSLKRLLAYSSIAHSGYLLVAILSVYAPAGSRKVEGGEAVLFYLLAYTFMTVGAFLCLSWIGRKGEHLEYMDEFRGLAYRNGPAAAGLAFFMLALAGMPPTAGFTAKYFAFGAAVKAGYVSLAVIGVLTSLISVYYYFRIIILMYMHDAEQEFEVTQAMPGRLCMLICVAGVLYLGLCPSRGWHYAQLAAKSLFSLVS